MKRYLKPSYSLYQKIVILTAVTIIAVLPASLRAQGDGPRFYWKTLAGMYAVPVIGSSMSGNANPLDPSHQVVPESDFNATMVMPGFARVIPLFKRSAMVSVIAPMGRITSNISTGVIETTQTARGFGDPMVATGSECNWSESHNEYSGYAALQTWLFSGYYRKPRSSNRRIR